MVNKYRKFRGGYRFKRPEGAFKDGVETAPIPSRVTIPLTLRFGSKVTPLVKKGDRIKAGQVIGRDDETISAPAIASVSGIVEKITHIDYYYGRVEAVIIMSDGTSESIKLSESTTDYKNLTFEKISELIYISGAASLGKSGIPTIFKSSPARPKSINSIIITTFGTGPFSLNETAILKEKEQDFCDGLNILKRALPNARIIVTVDEKDKALTSSFASRLPEWISIQPLEKKYPQESEDMLTRSILGKKIPVGGLGSDIGVLILDLDSVLRVSDAVMRGKPFIERTVAISGPACVENKFVNLRIGVSLEESLKNNIKKSVKARAIFGNIMTGLIQKDLLMPVGRSIGHITVLEEVDKRAFLAFMRPGLKSESYSRAFLSAYQSRARVKYETNMHGELRPCIQCGYCEEVCPVGIIPHVLSKQVKVGMCEELERFGIFECIDCGLCSYVCPCKIPLTDNIISGKKQLIEEGCRISL